MENFREYQIAANKTAIYRNSITDYVLELEIPDPDKAAQLIDLLCLSYAVLGLAGEAGELAGKLKKIIRDDKGIMSTDKKKGLKDENGDTIWYSSQVATELGESLEVTAENNILKLNSRKERGVIGGSGDNR